MEIQEQIKKSIRDATNLYQKLILLVGKSGSGKTKILQEISEEFAAPMINVNLEISYRLLDLPVDKRASTLSRLFSEMVKDSESDIVLLDNIEILFDKSLQQNPLALLQNNSKNKTLVAAWNGEIESGRLIYAKPDHHEYWPYAIEETGITIDLNSSRAV
ncbi:MAG: BREX-3 system P-loop-containing protein BrxF [Desulfobacterales bacterium]|nr:BREX-3 system P-loop-containing protein BrxF [Desulfobacterales bacterium]